MCDCTNNAPQANEEESELDKLLSTERYIGRLEAEVALLKELLKDSKNGCYHPLPAYYTVPCQLKHYPHYTYPTWYGTTTITTPGTYTITGTTS